jgi:hypothetical protein
VTPGNDDGQHRTADRVGEDVDKALALDRVAEEIVRDTDLHKVEPDADDEPMPTMSEQIADQLGGVRGLVESSVPVLTFVLLNFLFSNKTLNLFADERIGLYWAIGGSVAMAVVIAVYRLYRKESIRHAINGLVGIALGAYLAARSGQAKDFYLPGILLSFGQAAVLLISVGFRKPIIGYVWAVMANKGRHDWLTMPKMMKTFQWLTVAWAVSLVVRAGVQGVLYLSDHADWLGVARIFLSWPIYAGMLALTVWAVRRTPREPAPLKD